MIGCDGAKSSVRKAVDINFEPKSDPTEFLVADISVRWGIELSSDYFQLIQNTSGVLICIPMPDERWRIICTRKCAIDEPMEPFAKLQAPEPAELQQILSTVRDIYI